MKNLLAILALLSLCLSVPAAETAAPADLDVPVAPIALTAFEGRTNAFRLKNDEMEVVIVPAVGRIMRLGRAGQPNLLRVDQGLKGLEAPAEGAWHNWGGEWLWPVAQSRWSTFQEGDWPPSRLLDGRPWSGHAWKTADDSQCCLLSQDFGAPLHVRVTRLITLPKRGGLLVVQQRAERLAPSDIPITLWNISQVGGAEMVVLPVDTNSVIEGGFRPMMFGPPEDKALTPCGEAVVFDTALGGESKLCSDSRRAWIAACKGDTVIALRAVADGEEGTLPDNGCSLEMYSNSGLGYSEIETLSMERNLGVGEAIQNKLEISIRPVPASAATPCGLTEAVREWMGEKTDD
ncbi:MAG: hypothetical protein JXB04_11090 [Kiritimatiellae bacterium]|nr:hypothetical protein [Kiritimatiellia bacterium]